MPAAARAATAPADPRLIIPLDVPTADAARGLVRALGDAVSFYKVGLELFATDGMALARELKSQGKQGFLDWKLHDIPTTVARGPRGRRGRRLRLHHRPRRAAGDGRRGAGAGRLVAEDPRRHGAHQPHGRGP